MKPNTKERNRSKSIMEPLPLVRILLLTMIYRYPHSTGYSLIKHIAKHTNQTANLQTGSIYPELRKLERSKLVSVTREHQGRKRREYVITSVGMQKLREMINRMKIKVNEVILPIIELFNKNLVEPD